MSPNKEPANPSPAPSSAGVPIHHSRRPSFASQISRSTVEHDVNAQALDKIHTTASKTDTLTTFDFGSPPRPPSVESRAFAGDIVPSGLSQLYNRFKASVGGTKETAPSSPATETADDASIISGISTADPLRITGISSPPNPSTISSRIQSPAAPTFPDTSSSKPQLTSPTNPSFHSVMTPTTPRSHHTEHSAGGLEKRGQSKSRYSDGRRSRKQSGVSRFQHDSIDSIPQTIEHPVLPRIETHLQQENERTPRPLSRFHDSRTIVESSMSPSRKKKVDKDSAKLPSFKFPEGDRPPIIHVSHSHLPNFQVSRETSIDGDYSSKASAGSAARQGDVSAVDDLRRTQMYDDTMMQEDPSARMKSKVLAKELWMRDETAKECFYCGEPFSTFRRKHHCRICGNIFDGKCTKLVSGAQFGQSNSLRICKPCEAIVQGTDDDSSVYSDDFDRVSTAGGRSSSPRRFERSGLRKAQVDDINLQAPSLGIPVARKMGGSKRGSAVIEFTNEHSLIRPSSSRSLKSLSGLHRVPSHKRHHSRQDHQHMKSLKHHHDDRAPFQREAERSGKGVLPALHHDNIIDPDLAPFMSDEDPSEDEAMSIFATLNGEAQSPGKDSEKAGLASLMSSSRRKAWQTGSVASRDADNISLLSKSMSRQRRRNPSVSSFYHPSRPSPKRMKSNSLLKGFSVPGFGGSPSTPQMPLPASPVASGYKMIRSSAMRGSSAPPVELNQASLQHVRNLLKQMLEDAEIPEAKRWEKAMMPILLQCTDDVTPDIHRSDDIDIRHYIKLKKIPGSKPGDTAYVSGVVFTKNLALKSMPRSIANPGILLVTFPIEYARHHSHFMSLDPVIAQEREYLSNLVKRIAALSPQVLLVEKNVSGLALGFLEQAGIAVVPNVKASVLNAVSRCTQTKLITSIDKLTTLDPEELGKCASFDVKTHVFKSIKKTYIYLSGCQKDLGCTIVLRGADVENLRTIKRITEFMCYVVYNLKLETCVMRDEYVLIPATTNGGSFTSAKEKSNEKTPDSPSVPTSTSTSQSLTKSGSTVSQTRTNTSDLTSPTHTDSTIAVTEAASSTTKVSSEDYRMSDSVPSTLPSFYNDIVEEHKTKIISSSPFVKFMQPYLLTQAREQESKLAELKRLRDQYHYQRDAEKSDESGEEFELVKPEMVHKIIRKPSKPVRDFLFAVHDAEYQSSMHAYQTQKRQWEGYLSNNPTMFDPFNHQRIAFLYSMVNSKTNPCVGPEMIALSFYNEHELEDDFLPDSTLGQYVEELCTSGDASCSANDCNDNMFSHHRQYVHGDGQMTVTIQPLPPRIRGMQKTILMWSVCRICGQETQVMPMSDNTWKYSFGKYLELTFWSTALHPRAHACPHDIHRHHVRFFGFNNVAVRIQYDSIQLYDIVVPRTTVTWKVDQDLRIKNEQYSKFKNKLDRFMSGVKLRIESIHVESMPPETVDDCRKEVDRLLTKAKDDHVRLTKRLQEKYMGSRWYEIIPLNRAARAIQEISIEWDQIFADFEENFFPSEKDIRRMTALQLKRLFESATSFTSMDDTTDEGDQEIKEKSKTPVAETLPQLNRRASLMSPEDTKNLLASVIQEEHMSETPTEIDDTPTPTEQQDPAIVKEANEREDVKHLDLAVPPTPSAAEGAQHELSPPTSSEKDSVASESLRLSPEVSDTVDKMRTDSGIDSHSSPDAIMHGHTPPESRIPRPIDSNRRLGNLIAPPLGRAQSSPHHSISLLKSTPLGYEPGEASSAFPLSKTERLRNLLAEPARAFERSVSSRLVSRSGKGQPPSMIPRSIPVKRNVFNLARHYEQLTREFEKQRQKDRQWREARGAYPLASSKPVVEVYRDAHEAVKETDSVDEPDNSTTGRVSVDTSRIDEGSVTDTVPSDAASIIIPPNSSKPADNDDHSIVSEAAESGTIDNSTIEDDVEDTTVVDPETTQASPNDSQIDLSQLKEEKVSLLKMLTNFWGERSSSGWTPLEYPFAAGEHVWGDSDIIVREDEPSSIIAMALSSADYLVKLRQFRKQPENATLEDMDASIESNLLHSNHTNIRYAFQNRGVRAQCKIFYAESFDALRRKCGVAERFVESLSRCLKWDSKGGKTKSLFLKTLDDRFVLKSLSPVEVNSFFKFAPDYFVFAHAMLFNGLPSVIAKMLGLFQVTIRNPHSGMEFNWFMIVMENLFYDREPNRRFDLKGSMRNRKIQSTGERDEVLLDENLVDIIFEKPIFVREHTMKLLTASVWNDTLFLSKQNVMDYSLMAGFEDETREIVVGIIDCIRTYTWDKKLETWIKDRGKNKPTVTSPKDYRNRFRVAMSKYILQAPNCWHQFQAQQIQGRPVRLGGRKGDDILMLTGVDGKDTLPAGKGAER
ncbi:hypothetical protein BT63DRAFT_428901 [Microthyrium microscopicum]|uniref:1-phosphatidylinositol-3-phosphate 5-kinase n=1 Tax=Microthyrium microscopicum TaxID=703497 RepID=A0A6A6TXZ0_9PEZI|nr:hypothetical protein BT63DRAFT_428901 [Microthyrium microscopicum]